jgi:hypothetical protein
MKRAAALLLVAALGGCATDGTSGGGFYADAYWYDDPWYWSGCCGTVDFVGPLPHPEHPIVLPPPGEPSHPIATPPSPARPSQPIASPPVSRPTPMPRPAMRGGGGGRR